MVAELDAVKAATMGGARAVTWEFWKVGWLAGKMVVTKVARKAA